MPSLVYIYRADSVVDLASSYSLCLASSYSLHVYRPHTATCESCSDAAQVHSIMVLDGDVVPGERTRFDTMLSYHGTEEA